MAYILSTPFKATMASSFLGTPQLLNPARATSSSSPPCSSSAPPFLRIEAMKKIQGTVVCASNDKTVSVLVTKFWVHPKYKKRMKSSKKYHAHDPDNKCKEGDIVTLANSAPISKTKKFLVLDIKSGRSKSSLPAEEELDLPLESEAVDEDASLSLSPA